MTVPRIHPLHLLWLALYLLYTIFHASALNTLTNLSDNETTDNEAPIAEKDMEILEESMRSVHYEGQYKWRINCEQWIHKLIMFLNISLSVKKVGIDLSRQ